MKHLNIIWTQQRVSIDCNSIFWCNVFSWGIFPWVYSYLLPKLFYPHVDHRVSLCQTLEHHHDVPLNTHHLHHSVAAVMNTVHSRVDIPMTTHGAISIITIYKMITGGRIPNERGITSCVIKLGHKVAFERQDIGNRYTQSTVMWNDQRLGQRCIWTVKWASNSPGANSWYATRPVIDQLPDDFSW